MQSEPSGTTALRTCVDYVFVDEGACVIAGPALEGRGGCPVSSRTVPTTGVVELAVGVEAKERVDERLEWAPISAFAASSKTARSAGATQHPRQDLDLSPG